MAKSKPSKTKFYKYMTLKCGYTYKDIDGYALLLDSMDKAARSNETYMDLVDLTTMGKTDRLIFRNTLAEQGKEFTPTQIDEYIYIIEYALEYTP